MPITPKTGSLFHADSHLREQFKVPLDQIGPSTRDTEILERFFERKLADLPIAAIELAVVDDVAAFPELIERQRIDVWRASLFENDSKCFRICGRRVYQGAVHIERQQLIHA